ncbi:MAG: hypothetical protein ACYCRE_13025 [Acidobacteriaceae bacterium]
MRTLLLSFFALTVLACTGALHAQSAAPQPLLSPFKAPAALAACGPKKTHFAVKLERHSFTLSPPPPGLARVYLITETQAVPLTHTPITKIGMDGHWIGANKMASYLTLNVAPGRHRFCATIAGRGLEIFRMSAPASVALANLDAQAGHTYYLWNYSMGAGDAFTFTPINPDQAAMYLETMSESVSRPK